MEENKLREIFYKHVQGKINPDGMNFSGFEKAIDEYEIEKAKETCKVALCELEHKFINMYNQEKFFKTKELKTSCGHSYYKTLGNYCQFCGKPIEVVG